MKLAVVSETADLSGLVPGSFAEGRWLLVVEDENGAVEELIPRGEGGDEAWARLVVDSGCEGLLCGPMEREAFLIVADRGVTRYNAAGLSGAEALELARQRRLELIRDHIGGQGCRGAGHG